MSNKQKLLLVLCFFAMGCAAGYIAFTLGIYYRNNQVYEQMKETVIAAEPSQEAFTSPVDFAALQKNNPDIYAWVDVVGTDISYPILQNEADTDYYLDHTVDRAAGYPGAIYTQNIAKKDFSDFNTVIYGHNMISGAFFGQLEDYRDESFMQEHRTIKIYTPNATYTYQVFAAVVYDNRLINTAFDFDTDEGRMEFIASLDDEHNLNNHILTDVEITPEDHVITLSTCATGALFRRYLVLAVMTDVEE